jgi:hypothetical protein
VVLAVVQVTTIQVVDNQAQVQLNQLNQEIQVTTDLEMLVALQLKT